MKLPGIILEPLTAVWNLTSTLIVTLIDGGRTDRSVSVFQTTRSDQPAPGLPACRTFWACWWWRPVRFTHVHDWMFSEELPFIPELDADWTAEAWSGRSEGRAISVHPSESCVSVRASIRSPAHTGPHPFVYGNPRVHPLSWPVYGLLGKHSHVQV